MILLMGLGILTPSVSALGYIPYSTYTYSVNGEPQLSPHAYIPETVLSIVDGLNTGFSEPSDIVTDANDRLYIADTGNNRVVILNSDLTLYGVIQEFDHDGQMDALSGPKGVFVADNGTIYVSDTKNQRILWFSRELTLEGVIDRPESVLFEEDYEFHPSTLVVDRGGRLFVVSENMNKGILILDQEGNFKSFFGAQKVQYDPIEIFWRQFMTDEQIARTESFVPSEYNSITIDDEGFMFVTSSTVDPMQQYAATVSGSQDDQYAPVKRFGSAGVDVLYRNGQYPPSGDVSVSMAKGGPSRIVDCVPGKFGTYTLLDSKRNKLFTYDYNGELLYAFGGTGSQPGLFEGLCAGVVLSDDRILCLDNINNELTVFSRTDYGDLLFDVMKLHDTHQYSAETEVWEQILLKNNNLGYAYIGLGRSLTKSGEYKEAMELFRAASNKTLYSEAYEAWREGVMSDYLLLIPVVVILLVVGIALLFSRIRKFNHARVGKPGKRTLWEQIIFAFHTIFHPFDGYWDLHYEGRGSLKAGLVILVSTCVMLAVKTACSGYLYNDGTAFWTQPLVLILFVMLFVSANWCITSLTDGKGTAARVLTTTCYALLPLLLMTVPQLLLSHWLTLAESTYITLFQTVGLIWTGFCLFAGIIVTHQYSLGKAVLTIALTVVGMIIIVFLVLMFFNLMEPAVSFFKNYYSEVLYRF